MNAEILRRAAALMRERATTAPVPAGPWESEFSDVIRTDVPFGNAGYLVTECATVPEAKHIASWHPGVALAVANLLDTIEKDVGTSTLAYHAALAVARAYLRED